MDLPMGVVFESTRVTRGEWMTRAASRLFGCCGVLLALPWVAQAVPVRVDWSASVSSDLGAGAEVGPGTVSGTFGVFDVTAVGQMFALPSNGSLSVESAGFTSGFPNGTFPFTSENAPLLFEFTSVAPFAGELAGAFGALIRTAGVPCVVAGLPVGTCVISIENSSTGDFALAGVVEFDSDSRGPLAFTFTVVPEPGMAALIGTGLAVAAAARRGRAGTSHP